MDTCKAGKESRKPIQMWILTKVVGLCYQGKMYTFSWTPVHMNKYSTCIYLWYQQWISHNEMYTLIPFLREHTTHDNLYTLKYSHMCMLEILQYDKVFIKIN